MDSLLNEIKQRLVPMGIEKLILFGSFAYGMPTKDSDIDLLVVTSDEIIPVDFSEKAEVYLKVAREIESIRRRVPIDLIVHTRPMHRKFIELNSMFCREIMKRGQVLYEKNYAGVA